MFINRHLSGSTLLCFAALLLLWITGFYASLHPAHVSAQAVVGSATVSPSRVVSVTVAVTTTMGAASSTLTTTPASSPREIIVITPTPEAANVFAAATISAQLTEQATRVGTPTSLPANVRIATRTPAPRVVTATPTPANSATASANALLATAIAFTTGTPRVLVATATPSPTPSPTIFIITPTPQPVDVLEAATRKAEREAQASPGETPTSLPDNVVVATVTPTSRVVTNTPLPINSATATANVIYATAIAYTTGTPRIVTATPTTPPTLAPRQVTATAEALHTEELPTVTPTVTPSLTATMTPMPSMTATPTSTAGSTMTPTLTPSPVPTVTATPTVTPTPIPTETATPPLTTTTSADADTAIRIPFAPRTTHQIMRGYVDAEHPVRYVVDAEAGQCMTVKVRNRGGYPAQVEISTEENVLLGSASARAPWRGLLPSTQAYYVTVAVPTNGRGHDFALWLEIVP